MKTQTMHMVLDKGKQVPLTADLLRQMVKSGERIELILMLSSLTHANLVDARPLVNATKMRENRILELFSPWLSPKPVIHAWQCSLRRFLVRYILRAFYLKPQPPVPSVMSNEMS